MASSSSSSTLSFPPLLEQWKGTAQGRSFPGSEFTWKKALAPRPLAHAISEQTLHDLQVACGPRFNLLQQATQLNDRAPPRATADTARTTMPPASSNSQMPPSFRRGGPARGMPLYQSVWPDTTVPEFSVWDCNKCAGLNHRGWLCVPCSRPNARNHMLADCKRVGHAPPPNSLPAPPVSDMKVCPIARTLLAARNAHSYAAA